MAFQTADVVAAMEREADVAVVELRVDGGAAANDLSMQFQSDMLGIDVVRPRHLETTSLGAAYLAGISAGVWRDLDAVARLWHVQQRSQPSRDVRERKRLLRTWRRGVERAATWEEPDA